MNRLRDITGQVLMSGAFLVRQEEKTLFAGISKTLVFDYDGEFADQEIWVAQLIIPEPTRYSLEGSGYEGWELSDIITSEISLDRLTKL